MMDADAEADKLRADLVDKFGELVFTRALEMSGLRSCMQALATGDLTEQERNFAFERAGMHLARLQATYMKAGDADALSECAKRIDAAFETWTLDAIEARHGARH